MTTKTGSGEIVAERGQGLSGIKDTVSNLPKEIDDRTIQIIEKKLVPGIRPIERTKMGKKLEFTMRTKKTLRQKIQIRRLSGKGKDTTKIDTLTNTQRTRGEGTITRTPGQNKFTIKRGERIGNKEERKRKDHVRRDSKNNRKPMNQKKKTKKPER